mgnify:CR=1 FL=1
MSRTRRPHNSAAIPLTLIATKGHPATGKSAVARGVAQRLRIPLIDKDDVKDHVLGLPQANELAYAVMWQIAETQLALGAERARRVAALLSGRLCNRSADRRNSSCKVACCGDNS